MGVDVLVNGECVALIPESPPEVPWIRGNTQAFISKQFAKRPALIPKELMRRPAGSPRPGRHLKCKTCTAIKETNENVTPDWLATGLPVDPVAVITNQSTARPAGSNTATILVQESRFNRWPRWFVLSEPSAVADRFHLFGEGPIRYCGRKLCDRPEQRTNGGRDRHRQRAPERHAHCAGRHACAAGACR